MDDLIFDFIAETREMLEALGGEIVAWEAAPQDRARLDEIFRFVHTVKGNCGFFDLPRIKALSHAAEDALAAVRAGRRAPDAALVTAVLAVIDRIGELVEALETGESLASEEDGELIAALSEDAPVHHHSEHHPDSAPQARSPVRTIRLPVDLLDRMMSAVSDLVLARNELSRRLRESGADIEVDNAFDRVSATIADLRDAISRTRMQRIDQLFAPLPRMVRDLSADTGKAVTLEMDGGDVELDREMIEMIRDPLTHIVRNAIDHGFEDPAARHAAGKSEAGTLRVCARQTGNQILIEIEDDGRGIDGDRLVRSALAAGVISADQAERLSPVQKIELIFEAGLSTAEQVTEISGRGVGMDVVRANIERIGGLVDVQSRPGEGVRMALRVPLTLTIIPALTVGAASRNYAIPRSAIEEIVRVKDGAVRLEYPGGAGIATIRGRRMPLLSLAELLGEPSEAAGQTLIVLKPAAADRFALGVDHVHDHEELVVKPAAPAVMASGLYAGTTIADDGSPVLLLDPAGIAAWAGLTLGGKQPENGAEDSGLDEARRDPVPSILFLTLAGARRLVPVAAVQRIEDVPEEAIALVDGTPHVTLGETLLPLAGIDGAHPGRRIRILRLADGCCELAYGFDEVIDIVEFDGDLLPSSGPGETAGAALVDGHPAELLDLHWLFARRSASTSNSRPLCLLPAGDPWVDTILRPLVESAGYRTAKPGEPGSDSAQIVLVANAEAGPAAAPPGARIVRLRSTPEPEGGNDNSIHRYDRAGLLAALAGGGGR
jgi:two-component system chemotaxis sensor kinase CheA